VIIDFAYKKATKVLKENREGFTKLAELLLEKEVIFSEDLEKIFGKRRYTTLPQEDEVEMKKSTETVADENAK